MKTRNLIIALVFAGVTAWGLGQCVSHQIISNAMAQDDRSGANDGSRGDGGDSGDSNGADILDKSSDGGYCGCLGTAGAGTVGGDMEDAGTAGGNY